MNAGTAPGSSPVADDPVESAARGASRDDASSNTAGVATEGAVTLVGFGVAVLLVLIATALFARVTIRKRGAGPEFAHEYSGATQPARSSRNAVSELISRLDTDGSFSQEENWEKEPALSIFKRSSRLISQQTTGDSLGGSSDGLGLSRALGHPELEFDDLAFNMGPMGNRVTLRNDTRVAVAAPQNQEFDGFRKSVSSDGAGDRAGRSPIEPYDNAEAGTVQTIERGGERRTLECSRISPPKSNSETTKPQS